MPDTGDDALLYLDSAQVAELCQLVDPLEVIAAAFRAVRDRQARVAPEAALRWTAPDGTPARCLALPAQYLDTSGCKLISSCIGNVDRGRPRASGLIVLLDPRHAAPVCLLEAARISALRTAAVSLVALRAVRGLAAVRHVALLGCGRQARTHLELLATYARPEAVTVFDLNPDRAEALAAEGRRRLPGAAVGVAREPESAVRVADAVIAATTTTTPYVPLDWVRDGALFVNVSLDDASEELLLGCDHLVVDDWGLVSEDDTRLLGRLARAGRVTGPGLPDGGTRRVDADLATIVSGDYHRPVHPTDRVVVNPFGMGVHDLALAAQVYREARARGTGVWLPR